MAFRLYSTDDGHVPAWEYFECSAMTPKLGMCMALNASGQLEASVTPTFVCMRDEEAAVEAGTKIPVVRIAADQIWEAGFYSAPKNYTPGSKADVSTDGKWLQATTVANNTCEIVYATGNTMDDLARVRFLK